MCKNVVCFFCADEGPQADSFFGCDTYIFDNNFLCLSAEVSFNSKKQLLLDIFPVYVQEIAQ